MHYFLTKDRGKDGSVFLWVAEKSKDKPEFNEDGFWDSEKAQTMEIFGAAPLKINHSTCIEVSIKRKTYKLDVK